MRLSEWRAVAPAKPPVDPKVMAVVEPVLSALGAGRDPHCWVVWGDDVATRWQVLVPTLPGLLLVYVRVNVPGEGPRASAKLARWARVQVGELAVETQAGHRILSFSVEGAILRGVDANADRVAAFALGLIGAVDGRLTDVEAAFGGPPRGRRVAAATRGKAAGTSGGWQGAAAAATKRGPGVPSAGARGGASGTRAGRGGGSGSKPSGAGGNAPSRGQAGTTSGTSTARATASGGSSQRDSTGAGTTRRARSG